MQLEYSLFDANYCHQVLPTSPHLSVFSLPDATWCQCTWENIPRLSFHICLFEVIKWWTPCDYVNSKWWLGRMLQGRGHNVVSWNCSTSGTVIYAVSGQSLYTNVTKPLYGWGLASKTRLSYTRMWITFEPWHPVRTKRSCRTLQIIHNTT